MGALDVFRMVTLSPGWVELPPGYAEGLLSKGAGHKYIKRVPTGRTSKTGKPRYRYFYHVGHGGGVHATEHFVEGASFRHEGGHYHVTAVDGDKVTIKHDESGHTETLTKTALRDKLAAHHAASLKAHHEKAAKDLADAKTAGASAKQIAKLEARAKVGAASKAPTGTDVARPKLTAMTWFSKSRHSPLDAGSVLKTKGGKYVVVEKVEPSYYVNASDNEDIHMRYNGAEYHHPAHVRDASPDEVAHFDAANKVSPSWSVKLPDWKPLTSAPSHDLTTKEGAKAQLLMMLEPSMTDPTKREKLTRVVESLPHSELLAEIRRADPTMDVPTVKSPVRKPIASASAAQAPTNVPAAEGPLGAHHAAAAKRGLVLTEAAGGKSAYVTGNTYGHKDRIKDAGGKWDPDRKLWKVPVARLGAMLKGWRTVV